MKKIGSILMMSVTFLSIAHSQTNWFPIGAEWYYDYGNTNWGSYSRVYYVVEKDTVVEGKTCRLIRGEEKMKINDVEDFHWEDGTLNETEIVYEDNGRVYYYFDGKFRKIFDFAVEVGDRVDFEWRSIELSEGKTDTFIVTVSCRIEEIALKQLNGQTLTEIRASYADPIELPNEWMNIPREYIYLEKAGSEFPGGQGLRHGLFPYITDATYIPEAYYRMICYHDADVEYITDWWQAQGKPCEATVSNSLITNFKEAIPMYPNPVKDPLTISGESGNVHKIKILIYDATGKVVLERNEYLPYTLSLGHLFSGIYYVRIFDGIKCLTSNKIIKL
jgi:hypothetical protein